MYLLDTNVCIRVLNGSSAALVRRLRQHSPAEIRLCSIVLAELYYGARKSRRVAENLSSVGAFARPFRSLSFDDACAEVYGGIRAELEGRGQPIGPNDLMIAAVARCHDLTLVTRNLSEFTRVVGLKVVSWETA